MASEVQVQSFDEVAEMAKAAADAGLPPPEVKAYALVRDKNGKPKIDGNPHDLHPSIKAALTPDEFALAVKEWEEANGET